MITIKTENYNPVSQDFYNKIIDSLDLNLIPCTCGHSGCLIRYGSYKRMVQFPDELVPLFIVRVYCKVCGHTHALMLSSMVPYSQIPLAIHTSTAEAYEHKRGFEHILDGQSCIDENNLKSIIRNYRRHWRERLRSAALSVSCVFTLVYGCFSHYSRQFMQIKNTLNKLFIPPT